MLADRAKMDLTRTCERCKKRLGLHSDLMVKYCQACRHLELLAVNARDNLVRAHSDGWKELWRSVIHEWTYGHLEGKR